MTRNDREWLGGHVVDHSGERVNDLIVRTYIQTQRQGSDERLQMALWECKCVNCGRIQRKQRRYIYDGSARCTSCYMKQRRIRSDLTGKRSGRLVITALSPRFTANHTFWFADCDCGTVDFEVRRQDFMSGDTQSCGCLRREATGARSRARAGAKRPEQRTRAKAPS